VTVYAIAQLRFTDRDAYKRYQVAFMGSSSGIREGSSPPMRHRRSSRDSGTDKVVLMAFPVDTSFGEWT
jgi:uncharacterized protein (DUF1330 family)